MDVAGIFSESFWYIAPIIVTLTTTIAGLINQWFKVKKSWLRQVIAWAVASAFSVAAWGFHFIYFGQPVWVGIVALCIVTGLSSNGFYDITAIRNFINKWFTIEKKTAA